MVVAADDTAILQLLSDVLVELSPALIVRGNDERTA
jgi:hypothetical protein